MKRKERGKQERVQRGVQSGRAPGQPGRSVIFVDSSLTRLLSGFLSISSRSLAMKNMTDCAGRLVTGRPAPTPSMSRASFIYYSVSRPQYV